MTRPQRALLIGPFQQDNLALRYLASAASQAGHQVEVAAYNDRADIPSTVADVLARAPDLVGLSISFQHGVGDFIELISSLREGGYRGYLCCGGHVPTFCAAELLADVPGLDAAVVHEGEQTLVEILDHLARGRRPRDIAGLVWREAGAVVAGPARPPLAELDQLPHPERLDDPHLVGGVPVDFIIGARGCVGSCSYCSVAAFAGKGTKPFRLRAPEAIAEEIAELHDRRGTRAFVVQDDLFVLPSQRKAVERMDRLRQALLRRGVDDAVFWVKGCPDNVSDEVCQSLRALGAVHLFLGVESASAPRLAYLGRKHLPQHNHTAVERCRAHGIMPSFNLMLFDPDSSIEDVELSLALAERYVELPWNVCRTEIYSGTRLHARLQREGRLVGDYRSFGYQMHDHRAEIMFRVMRVCFHERALDYTSLLNRLITLSFARQLHEHLFPSARSERLSQQVDALGTEVRRDTLHCLREMLAFATSVEPTDKNAVRSYAVAQALRINERDFAWRRRCEQLWQQMHAQGVAIYQSRRAKTAMAQAARASVAGSMIAG